MAWPIGGIKLTVKNMKTDIRPLGNSVLTSYEQQQITFKNLSDLKKAVKLQNEQKIRIIETLSQEILDLLRDSGFVVIPPVTPPNSNPIATKLSDLDDVDATNKVEGYILRYVASTQKFVLVPLPVSAGGTGSVVSDSTTNGKLLIDGVEVTVYDESGILTALSGKANSVHSHSISDITNLQITINGKANTTHSHAIADITNLTSTLSGKASTTHGHAIADITNLVSTLADIQDRLTALENGGGGGGTDTTAPAEATNLRSSAITSNGFTLAWDASISNDVSEYQIFKNDVLLASVANGTGTTYNVTSLAASTNYSFAIKTKDTSNNVSSGSVPLSVTTASSTSGGVEWTYDFVVPQATGVYNLASIVAWTHTLTTEDVYGPNLDGVGPKMKLLTLGVEDGTPNEPGQELPRDGFDEFASPSMHGAFQYDESLEQLVFQSGAMNPYYFRIVKYA
jgi:chitodextrinase